MISHALLSDLRGNANPGNLSQCVQYIYLLEVYLLDEARFILTEAQSLRQSYINS